MSDPDYDMPISVAASSIFNFSTYFGWSQNTIGFGQLSLEMKNENGVLKITGDPEGMSKEWMRRALHSMVNTVIDQIPDPVDHDDPIRYSIDLTIPLP